ncbi:MAG: GNAT family N-acetyltransferase [Lachnospiraceae bacterium]|nr:GNAT family N-acetyltransferase [Lachnospiraceae bacterium]
MDNIEIYKVVDTDALEQCLEIRNRVFTLEKGVPPNIEVDQYDCLNKSCTHFLVKYSKNDIGTVRCLYTATGNIQIQRFCFLKEYRGLGLGKIVIKYIEDYYKTQGAQIIEMDAKYEVFGFYEKCGYKKVSEVFIEANIEHVKMMKQISASP